MSFARLQKLVTYLLAGLGLVSLSFGGEVPLGPLLALALGFVASWFVEGPILSRPWWSKTLTWLIAIALIGQILRGIGGGGGWLGLAMEFSGLLTLSRLCNRRSAADYQQIAMLAFIQLIAATVLTTDLGYAGVFVAFAVATPWVLTFAHLRREIERNYPAEADLEGGNDVARVLASRRVVDPSFLLWTALLSLPMLAMTVALFALFPRIGLGMLSVGANRGQHVSGFGSNVELGGFGLIRDDPTVVVRVTSSRPLSPYEVPRVLRLRGTSFDEYDGRKWTRSAGETVKMSPIGDYYPFKRMPRGDDLTLRLVLERLDEPVIFVPRGAVGLRVPERGMPAAPREQLTLRRGHGLDVRYTSSEELGIVYEAAVTTGRGESDVPFDRALEDEQRYLALPSGHERVAALARELTQGYDDPYVKAKRLEHYLRAEKRFTYTLELPDTRGKLPLVAFLFDVRRGHCEYFSSALAIMLRSVGIPARNVTGFVGGDFNAYGGYYAVRQADAHSWVEALLPGRGWVLLEPTPSARDDFKPSDLFRELRKVVDAARAYWMTRVVSYDLRTQLRALRAMRDFFRGLSWPSREPAVERSAGEPSASATERTWSLALIAVVALAAVAFVALRSARRVKRARSLSPSALAAQRLYRELEQTLRRRGAGRPPNVTPEAHARALNERGFQGANAVTELTDAYVRVRYGSAELDPARIKELKELLRDVKRAA